MGTYNNRGTSAPVGNTLVSYTGLVGVTQLNTYNTQLDSPSTLNKVNYSYVCSNTAAATSESFTGIIVISGTPQVNTISCDALDYFNYLVFQVL